VNAPSMAALNLEPVTERHARWCREHGHATHTVNGVVQGECPRCGTVSTHTHTADLFNWQCRHCYRINWVCGTCDAPDTCKGCGRDY